MNLYLISQDANNNYDTYDSAVVCAENEDGARKTNPGGWSVWSEKHDSWVCASGPLQGEPEYDGSWVDNLDLVTVKLIGVAHEGVIPGVVCASFNAG